MEAFVVPIPIHSNKPCSISFCYPHPFTTDNGLHNNTSPKSSKTTTTIHPTMAVFDFVKKAAQEQRRAFEAIKEGRTLEYIREKAEEDIGKVNKFKDGLVKSRERLARDLERVIDGGVSRDIEEILEELEEVLITADIGVDTVERILEDLKRDVKEEKLVGKEDVRECLKRSLVGVLEMGSKGGVAEVEKRDGGEEGVDGVKRPVIVMVIGANGMGKTTTIGKLATRLRKDGNKVLLAACDTFRAAAAEQLEEWARRADVDIVVPKKNQKSPAGVLYEALEKGKKNDVDYVIVDTSGRLHTNINLMGELQKMFRVVGKFKEGGPDETLLVVDASIGRNAVAQATTWKREVGVSGLVITKLDGTARAGFVVSVVNELGIPVKLVGVGESVDDLQDFDAKLFVDGLVG